MTRKRFGRKQPWPNRCNIPKFACGNWGRARNACQDSLCPISWFDTRTTRIQIYSISAKPAHWVPYVSSVRREADSAFEHLPDACKLSFAEMAWPYRLVVFLQFDSKVMWCGRRSLQLTGTHYGRMKWRVLMSSIGDVVAESVSYIRSLWNWQLYWISQSYFI